MMHIFKKITLFFTFSFLSLLPQLQAAEASSHTASTTSIQTAPKGDEKQPLAVPTPPRGVLKVSTTPPKGAFKASTTPLSAHARKYINVWRYATLGIDITFKGLAAVLTLYSFATYNNLHEKIGGTLKVGGLFSSIGGILSFILHTSLFFAYKVKDDQSKAYREKTRKTLLANGIALGVTILITLCFSPSKSKELLNKTRFFGDTGNENKTLGDRWFHVFVILYGLASFGVAIFSNIRYWMYPLRAKKKAQPTTPKSK